MKIWEQKESIILDVIKLYHQTGEVFTSEFPQKFRLVEVLRDKYEVFNPEITDMIQNDFENNLMQYLVKWIHSEFENSSGTLNLSQEEFIEYFQLEKGLATKIITELLESKFFVLEKSDNHDSAELTDRLQIDPKLSRNYWIKSKLGPNEADSLLEIGRLLRTAFNVGTKHLFVKDRHLVTLDLREQKLEEIPECIGNFPFLARLNLQSNLIESLPETIGNLKSLEYLDLDYSSVKALPESIGKLKNLEELWVRSKNVLTIPDSIGELKNLKKIAFNELKFFPKGLYKLNSLKQLVMRNNPTEKMNDLKQAYPRIEFPIPTIAKISKWSQPMRNWFLPLRKQNKPLGDYFLTDDDLLFILKPQYYQIFVLGNKGVGKTSLLESHVSNVINTDTPVSGELHVKRHEIKDLHLYEGVDQKSLTITLLEVDEDDQENKSEGLSVSKALTNLAEDKNCFEFWEIEEEGLIEQLEVAFFQECDGIMLCIDLTDPESIHRLIPSMDHFLEVIKIVDNELINRIPILVVGTKGDTDNSQAELKSLSLCEDLENSGFNLVSFKVPNSKNTNLMFFCEYNRQRKAGLAELLKTWITTSTISDKNISLAFKIIELATKEQQRVNEVRRMFMNKEGKKDGNGDFTPFPYIYSYPKGPPSGSGHIQSKKIICPNCEKIIDYLSESCPYCRFKSKNGF